MERAQGPNCEFCCEYHRQTGQKAHMVYMGLLFTLMTANWGIDKWGRVYVSKDLGCSRWHGVRLCVVCRGGRLHGV